MSKGKKMWWHPNGCDKLLGQQSVDTTTWNLMYTCVSSSPKAPDCTNMNLIKAPWQGHSISLAISLLMYCARFICGAETLCKKLILFRDREMTLCPQWWLCATAGLYGVSRLINHYHWGCCALKYPLCASIVLGMAKKLSNSELSFSFN